MSNQDLPQGWAIADISKVIDHSGLISDGDWVESKDQDINGTVRLIQLADVGDGEFRNKSARFMNIEATQRLNCTLLQEEDVLVARMPDPLGRACIFPNIYQDAVTVVDICLIRTSNKSAISNKLLMYLINTHYFRNIIEENSSGTTRKRITRKKLEKIVFNLPPLAEQKEIVRVLESHLKLVDQIKSRLDALPKILEQFRQSVLASAVSGKLTEDWRHKTEDLWELRIMGDVSKFQQGLQIAKTDRVNQLEDNVLPILRTVNYDNNFLDDVHYAKVTEKSIIADPLDLILSRTGTVGRVLTGYRGIMHNNSFRLNYDKTLLIREYLIYYLQSPKCQEYIKINSVRSSQPDLTHKAFAQCPILVPSIEEQTEIVKRVENLFALADQIEAKIKNAQERVNLLTQSILAKAFRGELTAKWREDNPDLISGENSAEALLKRIEAEKKAFKKK